MSWQRLRTQEPARDVVMANPIRVDLYPTSLRCSTCGYGIARATSPGPCPMCQADAWEGSQPLSLHRTGRERVVPPTDGLEASSGT